MIFYDFLVSQSYKLMPKSRSVCFTITQVIESSKRDLSWDNNDCYHIMDNASNRICNILMTVQKSICMCELLDIYREVLVIK